MKIPMPRETKYLRPVDRVRYGKPEHKEGLSVPGITQAYGSLSSKLKSLPFYLNAIVATLRELAKSVRSNASNPYSGATVVAPETLEELAAYARSLGVSGIGYAPVKDTHLFRESIVLFKHAIVFSMEMKKSEIEKAPSIRTIREIFRTYHELGRAVNLISEFLRGKGYNAQPIAAISNNINLTLLARDSGLGEFGKHGLLITKAHGPSVRLAAILTDIENLPQAQEPGMGWIRSFCDSCNACVRACPAQAIYSTPVKLDDGSERHIDYKRCAMPFSKQNGCTVCIKECAFFKGGYERLERAAAARANAPRLDT